MKALIALVIVIALGVGAYYMFIQKPASLPAAPSTDQAGFSPSLPAEDTPSTPPPSPVAAQVSVNIKNFAFNPSIITAAPGSKVTWTNNDSMPHTVTSDSGSLLNSGTIAPGQSFTFTFPSSGSFSYHCALHPGMKGTVTITN